MSKVWTNKVPKVITDLWNLQETKVLPQSILLLSSSFSYIDGLFELVSRIKAIIRRFDRRGNDYQEVLVLFCLDIETSIKSGFSLLLRGNPKHALACFRPGIESVGYVWHMYLDKTREKVRIWLEGSGREFDGLGVEIKDKEKRKAFQRAFFPYPEDNWPIYELSIARKDFSDWGAHSGIRGMQFYNVPLPPQTQDPILAKKYLERAAIYRYNLRLMNSNFLKMSRHMWAVMCEVLHEAFPSQEWDNLDISVLDRIIGYIWDSDLVARKNLAKDIVEHDTNISMKSEAFKKRSLEVGVLINKPAFDRLLEWIKSQPWKKPLRAKKVTEILKENIEFVHVRKVFKDTGSRFLDAPDGFPEP